MIPEYFIIKVRNFSINFVRRELAIHKNHKTQTNQNNHRDMCKNEEWK